MTDFTHTIDVSASRAAFPLRATVTATFKDDGTMDRWGLAVRGHEQSVKNRDTLLYILRGPCRGGISGDHIGCQWVGPAKLSIWDRDYRWNLTLKQARSFYDAIHLAIARFTKEANPDGPKAAPHSVIHLPDRTVLTDRSAELERVVAELRVENNCLRKMVRFLEQYRPKETAA